MNKARMMSVAAVAVMMVSSAWAAPQKVVSPVNDQEISIGVNDVFVPGGFDSRSDVVTIASGIFPNSCYQWSRAEVTRNTQGVVEVRPKARVGMGMCMMVLVPWQKEIHLGVLGAGEHVVRYIGGDNTYLEKRIKIEE